MFEKPPMTARVILLAEERLKRRSIAQPLRVRLCCHCGAALGDGESEDECSGAGFGASSAAIRRLAE